MEVIVEVESVYEQSQMAKSRTSLDSSEVAAGRASRIFLLDQQAEEDLYCEDDSADEYDEADQKTLHRLSGLTEAQKERILSKSDNDARYWQLEVNSSDRAP
jgi:hypothetical protein